MSDLFDQPKCGGIFSNGLLTLSHTVFGHFHDDETSIVRAFQPTGGQRNYVAKFLRCSVIGAHIVGRSDISASDDVAESEKPCQ